MNESPFFGAKTPGKYCETGNIFLTQVFDDNQNWLHK